MAQKLKKYEKYNKHKIDNIRLFKNILIKKGNRGASEKILNKILRELKKKRFQKKKIKKKNKKNKIKINQSTSMTLTKVLEEVSPALKIINVPFKKRFKWIIVKKKWRKRIKKRRVFRKKYFILIYNSKHLIKNGSRLLKKNIKLKYLIQEIFKIYNKKSRFLNLRKDFYKEFKKIKYESRF